MDPVELKASTARRDRYEKILAATPDNHLARFGLANVYLEQGDFAAAAAEYRKCLEAQRDWMAVCISLGQCLIRLGETAEARRVLEEARGMAVVQGHSGPQAEISELLGSIPKG
ncbi:MAG: CDC27 family protein [Acidobacteria bacterium]|nr:CDC27 family protein [Acidobacteriota bacterium]